jgi:hypothetical protein
MTACLHRPHGSQPCPPHRTINRDVVSIRTARPLALAVSVFVPGLLARDQTRRTAVLVAPLWKGRGQFRSDTARQSLTSAQLKSQQDHSSQ